MSSIKFEQFLSYIFCIASVLSKNSSNYEGVAVGATSIVREWKGDCILAQFDFLSDERCVIKSLHADVVFFLPNQFRRKLFSRLEEWSFRKCSQFAEVFIRLNSISDIDTDRVSFTFYVAGRQ